MPSSNVCWGIDIGAGGVKGVKLERDSAGGVRLLDFIVIPHKKVLSTPGLDENDAIRISLGALMSQYRDALRGATICVSVPGHAAFARFAKLPPVEPKGVPNLVKFEAVQQIPFPIEDVEWDYQTFNSPDSPDLEVGIFAITKERVNEKLSLWGDLGLNPDMLTLGPIAVYNAMAYDLEFTDKTPGTILLDIGTVATDLIIAEGGRVWMRTFPIGGHNFTDAINEKFQINSYTKADRLKAEGETSKFKQPIFQAIKPLLGDFVQDVQRSISYYQETHPDSNLQRLIGMGSSFRLLGLRKLLSQQLKMDVVRLERFNKVSLDGPQAADLEAATPTLATAYGLALQGLGQAPIGANLMPVSVVRDAMWKRKTPWFLVAAGLGLATSALLFLRPFMDSARIPKLSEDQTVQTAMRIGQGLTQAWNTESAANQPKFLSENIARLLEMRDTQVLLLRDVDAMQKAADRLASERKDAALVAGHAFDVVSFDAAYVPPGSPMGADAGPGRGGNPGGAGNPGAGGPGGSPESTGPGGVDSHTAGTAGAFRVTLVVNSQDIAGGLPFLHDSLLAWLKNNAERKDVPYTLVNIPAVEQVTARTTPATAKGGVPSPPGGNPGAPGMPDAGKPGAPGKPPPAPGGQTGAETLDSLAPLPDSSARLDPAKDTVQYTITWNAQMLPPGGAPAAPADSAGAPAGAGKPKGKSGKESGK